MFKKGTVLILAALLLLLAAGCDQEEGAPAGTGGTPSGTNSRLPHAHVRAYAHATTPAIYSWGGATLAFRN